MVWGNCGEEEDSQFTLHKHAYKLGARMVLCHVCSFHWNNKKRLRWVELQQNVDKRHALTLDTTCTNCPVTEKFLLA